ncbi:Ubiquitin domain-containing protein ubfd1 [Tritrichomonas musculus]|uniref:Ubiquitin domain-containing protein ubfd1 n=1 Tax=Tritrichomonas musculus TaxID=1915356 RepID=A0ABR2HJZ4_9EUKA
MLKLQIRFHKDTIPIEVAVGSNISQLMDAIYTSLSIPPERQQIIYKGQKINMDADSNLDSFKISNGTKLLLLQTDSDSGVSTSSANGQNTCRFGRPSYSVNMQPEFLNAYPHAPIIAKGIPPKCEKPFQSQMVILPKNPFPIYNTEGTSSNLSFETDAIWVTSENQKNERIFFSDIKNSLIQDIPGYEKQYVALCLLTKYGKRWFYFIPNQYSTLIKQLLP